MWVLMMAVTLCCGCHAAEISKAADKDDYSGKCNYSYSIVVVYNNSDYFLQQMNRFGCSTAGEHNS